MVIVLKVRHRLGSLLTQFTVPNKLQWTSQKYGKTESWKPTEKTHGKIPSSVSEAGITGRIFDTIEV